MKILNLRSFLLFNEIATQPTAARNDDLVSHGQCPLAMTKKLKYTITSIQYLI
ncbi:hypothetical protein [Rickettsia hoogstraalii]|uniref:hypothetical protein n=1 Tax=Rickettsia hoogstraalii TaxID=467174 RepID=UPI000A72027B|nr:hypothetical protein [Rickettsia hoogstraalii]